MQKPLYFIEGNYSGEGQSNMCNQVVQNQGCVEPNAERNKFVERYYFDSATDERKQALRKEYTLFKEALKNRTYDVVEGNEGVMLYILTNDRRIIISQTVLFKCQIVGVKRYRKNTGISGLFQFILKIPPEKQLLETSLYPDSFLEKSNRLKQTDLSKFHEPQRYEVDRVAWEWIWKTAKAYFDTAEVIKLPDKVGWFFDGNQIKFADARYPKFWMQEQPRLRYLSSIDATQIGEAFGAIPVCKEAGALLLFRLVALLRRFYEAQTKPFGVVLFGKNASEVARHLLGVREPTTVFNLDCDRIEHIEKYIFDARDDVVIFTSSATGTRSMRNRLDKVLSWYQTGFIEGKQVKAQFVFCMEQLNIDFVSDGMIVLESCNIQPERYDYAFTWLQSLWVDCIEKSGSFIADRMVNGVKFGHKGLKDTPTVFEEITADTYSMLGVMCGDGVVDIKNLLKIGLAEINTQISNSHESASARFHDAVLQLVGQKQLRCVRRDQWKEEDLTSIVFDEENYYFSGDCLNFICKLASIDQCSIIQIKRSLCEQECIRTYHSKKGSKREFQIDLSVGNSSFEKKTISVLAVKNSYWDSLAGIHLYERSY